MNYKLIGRLKVDIIQNYFNRIITDEVILMDSRMEHIKLRRGEEFLKTYYSKFPEIITNPDYILLDNKPNTVLMRKKITENNGSVNIVVRLVIEGENPDYKNSIITAVREKEKRFSQRLRNMSVIYEKLD